MEISVRVTQDIAQETPERMMQPKISILVLLYGPCHREARRCLESILGNVPLDQSELIVGANIPCRETIDFLQAISHRIEHQILSDVNLYKDPMMKQMLAKASGELVWWFDDDSHITSPAACEDLLKIVGESDEDVVQWGQEWWIDNPPGLHGENSMEEFVRKASWYRGRPMPESRWHFATGGCWLMRRSALETLKWPDPRLRIELEDLVLGEAIRQQGWKSMDLGQFGVAVNDGETRWT